MSDPPGCLGQLVAAVRPARAVPDHAIPEPDERLDLYELTRAFELDPLGSRARYVGRSVRTWGRVRAADHQVLRLCPESATDAWPATCAAHLLARAHPGNPGDAVIVQGICRGIDDNDVLVLRPARVLHEAADPEALRTRRRGAQLVVVHDGVWILGGIDVERNAPDDTVEQLTLEGRVDGPSLRSPRVPAAFVGAADGTVWALGGRVGSDPAAAVDQLTHGQWRRGPRMPFPWQDGVAAAVGDGVLVAGGVGAAPMFGPPQWRRETLWLAAGGSEWASRARLPEPRRGGRLAALPGGRALWLGGDDPEGSATDGLLYDPARDAWRVCTPPVTVQACGWGVVDRDRVLFAGPHGLTAWDPVSGDVASLPALPEARRRPSVLALPDGSALVVGGEVDAPSDALGWRPSAAVDWVDVARRTIVPQEALQIPRAHLGLAHLDATATATMLVIGGVGTGGWVLRSVERRGLPSADDDAHTPGGRPRVAEAWLSDEE